MYWYLYHAIAPPRIPSKHEPERHLLNLGLLLATFSLWNIHFVLDRHTYGNLRKSKA